MSKADIQYKPTGLRNNNYNIINNTVVFKTDKPNAFSSSEITLFAKLKTNNGVSDNEISVRWSAAPHIGDNIVKCFDLGFGIKNGKTRLRYEHKHPEYTDVLAVGGTQGVVLNTDDYIGLRFVKLNLQDETTLFNVYQNTNNDDWVELFSFVENEYFVGNYPNGCEIAIKPKENFNNISMNNVSVVEIVPVDQVDIP